MKKVLSVCLAIFMVLAAFQGVVFAEDETSNLDDRYLWIGCPPLDVADLDNYHWEEPPAETLSRNYMIDYFLGVIMEYSNKNLDPLSYWEDFVGGFSDDAGPIVDEIKEIYFGLAEGKDPLIYIEIGDVDFAGEVTVNDARLALRIAVGLAEYYPKYSVTYMAADIDRNGEVSTADARAILRVAVGLDEF